MVPLARQVSLLLLGDAREAMVGGSKFDVDTYGKDSGAAAYFLIQHR